jgi:uncharacterized membrane protein YfcA
MEFDGKFALVLLFVFIGFTTQTVAGFGAMLIALTLSMQLYPVELLLPLLIPVSVIQSTAIVVRHRGDVDWRLIFAKILPAMTVGAIGGLAIAERIEGPGVKYAFGVMVCVFALRELWRLRPAPKSDSDSEAGPKPPAPLARPLAGIGILGAGVTHGIYACGGPLLVYVVGRLGLGKGTFRATLTAVFLILNVGITVFFVFRGRLGVQELPKVAATLPVLATCLVVGEFAHDRIDEHRFRLVVFSLLLLAGLTLLIPA